ncbi:MAG: cupin domain-containing protein [Halanaerobiales bacterium]|nr:cupin domain-containing protein [Halanaerobiales bacterium]
MLERYTYVGKKIRKERLRYGLSLSDLAASTDLSASFLSLLENGKTAPSLKVLDKLCTYFSIHMAALFEEDDSDDFLYLPREKQIEVATENERILRFLLPKTKDCIDPVLITLFPNSTNQDFTVHNGIEFGYILEGIIEVHIEGKEPLVCCKGDSILYPANHAHKLVNPTDEIARGFWVGVPNTNSIF